MGKKKNITPPQQLVDVFKGPAPFVTQMYLSPVGPIVRITLAETTPGGQKERGAFTVGLDTLQQFTKLVDGMLNPPQAVTEQMMPPPTGTSATSIPSKAPDPVGTEEDEVPV